MPNGSKHTEGSFSPISMDLLCSVYAKVTGSPYIYRKIVICIRYMGVNDMQAVHMARGGQTGANEPIVALI